MGHILIIERQVIAFNTLKNALPILFKDAFSQEKLFQIISNGLFSPAEDEEISYWFARFLTVRRNLWQIVDLCINNAGGMNNLSEKYDYQYFVLGYGAVCLLIRMDRFLINDVASHTLIQRKLNEALPKHRISRKQFMTIQESMLKPSNAIRIHHAHKILKKRATAISEAVVNSPVEGIFNQLPSLEEFINLSRRDYLIAWLQTRRLSLRRRGASAKQKSIFAVLEYGGRFVSEVTLPIDKNVTSSIKQELEKIAKPGDVLITRHHHALTNLFLPGYWPHAALYVGENKSRIFNKREWKKDTRTFEALKDGVRFRTLDETLSVDAFVLIRPNFTDDEKMEAIRRVIQHEGKSYNFDFDFFRSDQLVCTEVIYRAYDGINNKKIPLKERMGNQTLSAQDLLDLSLDTDWADVIAIYGVGKSKQLLVNGIEAIPILENSYRN